MEESAAKPKNNFDYARLFLPGAVLLAALIISGTLIFTRGQNSARTAQIGGAPQEQGKPADVKAVDDSNDHILGKKSAGVTIIEYSDFQCSFCGKFWSETLPQIKKDFVDTGKARFVYRHFPLQFHSMAKPAAIASECAGEQGKFWQMHDKIYEEQKGALQFTVNDLKKWAAAIGLDAARFNQCLDGEKYAEKISNDFASGQAAGVSGTPTFFINGQKIVGAQPYENFKAVIESLLK